MANVEVEGSEPYIVGGHTASGYWIDVNRATTLKGLFAAGDVAGGCPQKYVTGSLVEGKLAALAASKYAKEKTGSDALEIDKQIPVIVEKVTAYFKERATQFTVNDLEEAMQQVMDEYAGGISTAYRYTMRQLAVAKKHIARLERLSDNLPAADNYELMKIFELKNRLLICKVLLEHLQARKETRWHSFAENLDYPAKDSAFEKYINSRLENGIIKIISRPLVKRGDKYEHQY